MSKSSKTIVSKEYIILGVVVLFFLLIYFYLSGGFLSSVNKNLPVVASSQDQTLTSLGRPDADTLSFQSDVEASSNAVKDIASQAANLEIPKEGLDLSAMMTQIDDSSQKIEEVNQQLATSVVATKDEKYSKTDANIEKESQEARIPKDSVFERHDGKKVKAPAESFENNLRKAIISGNKNTPIIFDQVSFKSGSKNLNSPSDRQITSAAALLETYKDINVVIRGHSDNRGTSQKNAELSLFRSGSMKKALVDLGVDPKRIHIEGLGAVEPIDSNKTKRGRQNNRRIDLVITE